MENASRNLLLFTIYTICVYYVFYEANKSLRSQVVIEFDSASVKRQIEDQNLRDRLELSFIKIKGSYQLDQLKTLIVKITNKSDTEPIYVDWDKSNIINFEGVQQRAIRVVSGMQDISESQVESTINPGKTLTEELSNENIIGSLFVPKQLAKAAQANKTFSIELVLRLSDPITTLPREYNFSCKFVVRKLRWKRAFSLALKAK